MVRRGGPLMDRRQFVCGTAGALCAVPGLAAARSRRLGILHGGRPTPASDAALSDAITGPLRGLGYAEGRNLVIERRYADGQLGRLPGFARELLDLKVDVILAVGGAAIQAAKDATTSTPIVLFTNTDPVAAGFVQSLARPGGNITGVLISPEGSLAGKRMELLAELVPRASRIGFLAPGELGAAWPQRLETRAAAAALALRLDEVGVNDGDYAQAFEALAALRPQALVVASYASFLRDREPIIALAAKYRLPAIYEWPRQVRDGGLMSYGADDVETYQQVASYIDRIFKGDRPGDLPIWLPSRLRLVINRGTAKALGITQPQTLLLRADGVIE